MSQTTYLAKDGKLTGPYSADQIEVLKKDGSFYTYEWMWDGESPDWTPVPRRVKGPPSLPKSAPKRERQTATHIDANVEVLSSNKVFQAICYDNRHFTLSGEITQANSRSARFVSSPSAKASFPKGAQIWVDLLDEKTDRAAKIKSVVTSVSRVENRWTYDIQWQECPLLDNE